MFFDKSSTSKERDLAYLAGFFDGEGNVGVHGVREEDDRMSDMTLPDRALDRAKP